MLVNLERAMSAMDRFGGHFVMGHVDHTGTIAALEPVGQDHRLEGRIPEELTRYCIDKGSITIDGISLTIANLSGSLLEFWITPPYFRPHESAECRSRPACQSGSGYAGQVCRDCFLPVNNVRRDSPARKENHMPGMRAGFPAGQ